MLHASLPSRRYHTALEPDQVIRSGHKKANLHANSLGRAQIRIEKAAFAIVIAIGITSAILLAVSVAVDKVFLAFGSMSAKEMKVLRAACLAFTVLSLIVAGRRNAKNRSDDRNE